MTLMHRKKKQKPAQSSSGIDTVGKTKINNNGFTIIEVMIAIAILSIGLLGIAKMQVTAIKGNHSSMKFTRATIIAQDQVEILMRSSFAAIVDSTVTDADGYETVVTTTNIDADGDGDDEIKNVNIAVSDPLGKKRAEINFLKAADF